MSLFIKKLFSRTKRVKVAINMKPLDAPWGGINTFIEQLSCFLREHGYAVTYHLDEDVTCILMVKSWPTETATFAVEEIRRFKQRHPDAFCIQRINECDLRKGTDYVDELLKDANQVADCTVFISHWLKDYFSQRWFDVQRQHEVIHNGADPRIFFPIRESGFSLNDELRIVTHHWSDNWMKGFKVYQEVDRLIAEKELQGFSLTVIGRWPKEIQWRSAITYPPMTGKKLAKLLRRCHIYLTASLWEPCGMHHIEGAQCGLPLVYHEDGGGIVEFGKCYGISFRGNIKDALINAKQNFPELKKRVPESMPSGNRMCVLYESLISRVLKKETLIQNVA